jgi:hypothetical protein
MMDRFTGLKNRLAVQRRLHRVLPPLFPLFRRVRRGAGRDGDEFLGHDRLPPAQLGRR